VFHAVSEPSGLKATALLWNCSNAGKRGVPSSVLTNALRQPATASDRPSGLTARSSTGSTSVRVQRAGPGPPGTTVMTPWL
jgi:hypothetical protein